MCGIPLHNFSQLGCPWRYLCDNCMSIRYFMVKFHIYPVLILVSMGENTMYVAELGYWSCYIKVSAEYLPYQVLRFLPDPSVIQVQKIKEGQDLMLLQLNWGICDWLHAHHLSQYFYVASSVYLSSVEFLDYYQILWFFRKQWKDPLERSYSAIKKLALVLRTAFHRCYNIIHIAVYMGESGGFMNMAYAYIWGLGGVPIQCDGGLRVNHGCDSVLQYLI